MKNVDVKILINNLIGKKSISIESIDIVAKSKAIISEYNIEYVSDVLESKQIFDTYSRREKSLSISGVEYYGVPEVLRAIKNNVSSVMLVHGVSEDYNLTIFLDGQLSQILGLIVINKQQSDLIKKQK